MGQAASFAATTLSGSKLEFPADYQDKVVLLDFWATWCGPCVAELPKIKAAYADYRAQGLAVVGITLDGLHNISGERVQRFAEENEMPWPQVYENADQLARKFGVAAIPAMFLVDGRTGEVLAQGRALEGDGLKRQIEAALAGRGG